MSQRPRYRTVAFLLSVVPGWGHVYWGRERLGLALFTFGAVFGFALINGLFIYQGKGRETFVATSAALFLAVFAGTWIDLFLRTTRRRLERDRQARSHLLQQGTIAYLRSDFENAEILFRECLRIDPHDVEAIFRLALTFARCDNRRQALRWLRKTLRADYEEKWRWEVSRELLRLDKEGRAEDSSKQRKETTQPAPA